MTRSTEGPLPRGVGWVVAVAGVLASCASHRPPPAEVVERARLAPTYSASLRVSLKGPGGRGRTPALLAFERPDRMRIEIPGPSGLRLLAVLRDGRLVATFPSAGAIHAARASAESLDALLGVGLETSELMDFLVGVPSPRLSQFAVHWGAQVPAEVQARLPDGTRLRARVLDATLGENLAAEVFAFPPTSGLRVVDADEARRLLVGR